jgi:16S rRNA (uracil1498-N3)-methyltransferase
MTAHHFFAPDVAAQRIVVSGEDARHASAVLRIRPGEIVTISDGRGAVVEAEVSVAGRELVADVRARRSEPPPRPRIAVFQAIPKSGKLDLVVQKLTELGVDRIRLFRAERSVARWDEAKAGAQTRRLGAIARQAAEQSRRAWLPEIEPPATIDSLDLPEPSLVLEAGARLRIGAALPPKAPEQVGLVVGPEGGLTREELDALAVRGAVAASLGRLILRTETAALAAVAVLSFRYGGLG